jgi:hypothetical protein
MRQKKLKSYLFDMGDSNHGPIGYCARVRAESKEEAADILREAIPEEIEAVSFICYPRDQRVEYFNVYINPDAITADIINDGGTEDVDDILED